MDALLPVWSQAENCGISIHSALFRFWSTTYRIWALFWKLLEEAMLNNEVKTKSHKDTQTTKKSARSGEHWLKANNPSWVLRGLR